MNINVLCKPPFSSCFLVSLKSLLTSGAIWLTPSCQLVFLCGKRLEEPNCARRVLLEYARKHIRLSHFFLAEDAFAALRDVRKSPDLLSIESYLADCADCIIIILESDGAKVELGAFAHINKLAEIVLVVNEEKYRGETSFIADGPLKKLDRKSKIGPTIYTRLNSIGRIHHVIEDRLNSIRRKRRKRLYVPDAATFRKLPPKDRAFILTDLIWALSPVSYAELVAVLTEVLGKAHYDFLKLDLSLLQSLKFVASRQVESGQWYYVSTRSVPLPFCEYDGGDSFAIRAEAIANYHKRDRPRLALLKERVPHV